LIIEVLLLVIYVVAISTLAASAGPLAGVLAHGWLRSSTRVLLVRM